MAASTCPECRKGTLHWETRQENERPIDTFVCKRCDYIVAIEDWHVPAEPLKPGRCWNCGGPRRHGICADCALTEDDDRAVHEELRQLIHPSASRLSCAQLAVATGRRLLALKLATAEAQDGPQHDVARALRVQLLRQIGEASASLSDARQWTADDPDSVAAWGTFADALVQEERLSEAVRAFERALELDPDAHRIRARQARVFLDLNRYGQAQIAARRVLDQRGDREATLAALDVMARYIELLIDREDLTGVKEILNILAERARRHPAMLAASAWLALKNDDVGLARRELKEARKLQEDHLLIAKIHALLKAQRRWWFW